MKSKMRFGPIVVSAGLLCAVPALATPTGSVGPADALGTYGNQNLDAKLSEIVCRYEPPPTGTRIGGFRECETLRYWNGIPQHIRRMLLY
jgi:hypothetical protein